MRGIPGRIDKEFKKELREIKLEKIKRGITDGLVSDRRLTLGIKRHMNWPNMKEDLIKADLSSNKRGSIMDIFIWMIIAFITILFFASWMYGHDLITTALTDLDITIGNNTNFSTIANDTFGQVNNALSQLRFLAIAIIFGMIITIFVSNFLTKAHPVFFIVYFLITVVAIIFSVFISNTYETLMGNSVLGSTLQTFIGGSFIILNLPIFVTVVGLLGGVFLFIGITRDTELGGGIM